MSTLRICAVGACYELLQGYGAIQRRGKVEPLEIAPAELFSMDEALAWLERSLGTIGDWTTLSSFLPDGIEDNLVRRSALAATLSASLEMVRSGRLAVRQDQTFGPIYVRRRGAEGLSSVGDT